MHNPFTEIFTGIGNWWGGRLFARALRLSNRSAWQNQIQNNRQPVPIDIENLIDVYSSCPHLQVVISKKAEMLSNGFLKVRNIITKEEIENHPALQILKSPNPLQNFKQFIIQYSILNDIYSNSFFYQNKPFANSTPRTVWNLPGGLMTIVPTGKLYDQMELSGIIEKYQMQINSRELRNFTTDEVIHFSDGISKNPLLAESKLISLCFPIINIIGALKTRNIFIYYGPKIILSSNKKDSDGGLPLKTSERERIEKEVNQEHYGIDDRQSHMVITDAALTSNMLSFPTKDLMLFEEIEDDFAAICGAFGMDRDIFPSTKGATFENKKQGELSTYQSTIEPSANEFCGILNRIFQLTDEEIFLDYSHLAIMQTDKLKTAQEQKTQVEKLSLLLRDGVISHIQYAELAGVEMDGSITVLRAAPKLTIEQSNGTPK